MQYFTDVDASHDSDSDTEQWDDVLADDEGACITSIEKAPEDIPSLVASPDGYALFGTSRAISF